MDAHDSGCRGVSEFRPIGRPKGLGISGLKKFLWVVVKKCGTTLYYV